MKKIKCYLQLIAFMILAITISASAQENNNKALDYRSIFVFDSDSLKGFDEQWESASALAYGCYGNEYKIYMFKAKRRYINTKYNIVAPTVYSQKNVAPYNLQKSTTLPSSGACSNEDFEDAVSGQVVAPTAVNGWTITGANNGADFCLPPQTFAASLYTVFNGPISDVNIGAAAGSASLITSYFDAASNIQPAGSCFIKIGDGSINSDKLVQMTKSFTVTPSNALFQYAFKGIIEDSPHACCDQPGFKIRVTITNTATSTSTLLACPQISIAVPGPACAQPTTATNPTFLQGASVGGSTWKYTNWTPSAIDLSPYIGFFVQIDVFAIDCAFTGHQAYMYFDAKCSPMTIVGNGNQFPAGTPSINIPTCGSNGATITLPAGLGPYSWTGGGSNPVPPSYSAPSFTNQTYTTSVSGPYTVVMNPAGSCVPITKTLNVVVTPAPQLFASIAQAGCASTLAIATCTTAGSASVSPTIIWSPAPLALSNNNTQATYQPPVTAIVLTVTATDFNNCPISKTLSLLPASPAITFNVINTSSSNSITCANPIVTLSASTSYTNGPLSYSWTSTTFTAASATASITQPQTVQATAWDLLTGCSVSTVVTVPINTIAPTSTVTPISQVISCGLGGVQTLTSVVTNTNTNYEHCWYIPGGAVSCYTGSISIFTAPPGTTTVVVTNPVNGCTTTKTVSLINGIGVPIFTVTSTSNFSLGCAPSKNTTTLNFVNAITSPINGVPVSYTVLPPGFTGTYSILSPSVSPTSTVITVPGTYTVIIKDQNNNCETRVNVAIIQNTVAPASVISVSNNAVNSFALSCFTPSILAVGSSTVPNATAAWVTPSGTNIPQSSIPITVTTNTASTSVGTYTLKVEDPNNGCISFKPFPITQSIQPPIAIITNSNTPNVITCRGIPVSIKNSSLPGPAGGVAVTVLWAVPSPQLLDTTSTTYNAYVAGVYSLTVRNTVNGCTATGTLAVGDNLIPPIYPTPIAPYILDCSATSVKIGVAPTNSTSTFQYNWTTEILGASITPVSSIGSPFTNVGQPGEYRVDVFNPANGCTASQTFQVLPGDLTAGFTTSSTNGFAPLAVSFVNTSTSSGTIAPTSSITSNWNFGNGTPIITTIVNSSQASIYNSPGTYTVVLIAKKGLCTDTATQVIVVDIPSKLTIPNVFTPNGDGANDKFKLSTQNLTNIEATIFDRWGNKVFETTSDKGNIEWDGMNLYGKESANGTYFYFIKADGKDGKEYIEKGTVSLYR